LQIFELDDISVSKNANDIWSTTLVSLRNVALKVLTTLVDRFEPKKYLDPFPKTRNDVFRDLQQSLNNNINNGDNRQSKDDNLSSVIGQFVEKGKIPFCGTTKTLHHKEGLARLLLHLQHKNGRKELKEILQRLANGQGLSEEAAER
jgi:hypothetical protein